MTENKIVALDRHPSARNERLVELLKKLLEQAEAGHLQSLAVAAIDSAHHSHTAFIRADAHGSIFELLGATNHLAYRMNSESIEK